MVLRNIFLNCFAATTSISMFDFSPRRIFVKHFDCFKLRKAEKRRKQFSNSLRERRAKSVHRNGDEFGGASIKVIIWVEFGKFNDARVGL